MSKTYRSARGEVVNFDLIRLNNENTIAIGNMKTNARGDELGPGGKVVKSRAQVMQEYHKLNTPVATDAPVSASQSVVKDQIIDKKLVTPMVDDTPIGNPAESADQDVAKPRGRLADAVAKSTEVKQELLQPAKPTSEGLKRI